MRLYEALGLEMGQVVAFVGAGGKTTAIWRVMRELDGPVVFTSTTKIMEPVLPAKGALMLSESPDPGRVRDLLAHTPRLVLAAGRLPGEYSSTEGHPVPSLDNKLQGLAIDVLDQLVVALQKSAPLWLVEADGAKGCGLKVPADHEPVIPLTATRVVVCAHLDIIGQAVSDKTVHRLAQAETLGMHAGKPITSDDFVRVLADSRAGLKGLPPGARAVALLTQRDQNALHPQADSLCEQLVATGKFERVVVAALRAPRPVLFVKSKRPIVAIVLAAGASTRLGQPKQLLDWHGKPLLRQCVDQIKAAGLDSMVVLGCNADQIQPALVGSGARVVTNADWELGLSASLREGLAAVPDDVEAVLFVQADQPYITLDLLSALVSRYHETGASIVVPLHQDRRGTPVLFARALFDELMSISGDEGGRSLIAKYPDRVATVQVNDPNVFADIDTAQDYNIMHNDSTLDSQTSILRNIQGLISDMDGVLWRGKEPMPGLGDFFAFLRRSGIRFVLATNNASRMSLEYVERLADFGVQVSQEEILCAAEATAEYLANSMPGATVFVIGEPSLVNVVAERGLIVASQDAERVDGVVVGWDRDLNWRKLARATQFIRGGARFIGTNPDRTWPSEWGLLPGNGANLAFLQAATDVEPVIIGKPGRAMYDQALARLGLEPSSIAMVGDRLETDIEGGHRAGLATIFVCSGVHTRQDAERYPVKPDLIFEDIAELMQAWEEALRSTTTR